MDLQNVCDKRHSHHANSLEVISHSTPGELFAVVVTIKAEPDTKPGKATKSLSERITTTAEPKLLGKVKQTKAFQS